MQSNASCLTNTSVLFMEFFSMSPPDTKEELEEQYNTITGGTAEQGYACAAQHAALVQLARSKGIDVVGLHMYQYSLKYFLDQVGKKYLSKGMALLAYASMRASGYDIAATRRELAIAQNKTFLVFIGSAHIEHV